MRDVDDAVVAQLKVAARARNVSVEAIAREALTQAAELSVDEKRAIFERMRAWSEGAKIQGVAQTSGVALIRGDRDRRSSMQASRSSGFS